MDRLVENLKLLKGKIEEDTWSYLESGDELPKIKLSYKSAVISIPIDLAETNQFIQVTIDNLIDLIKDVYLED